MHDIGVMVFSYLIPDQYSVFIRDNWSQEEQLHVLEEKEFGINHSHLGAIFIKKWWSLKPEVADSVLSHHSDLSKIKNISPVCKVVNIANDVASSFGFAHKVIDSKIEKFDEDKLVEFGISRKELEKIVDETREDLENTSEILYK